MITRRFFIFGTAAVIAMATADAQIIERIAIPARMYPRRLQQVTIHPVDARDPAEIWLRRPSNDSIIHHLGIPPNGCAVWRSLRDLDDIWDTKDMPLAVEVLGGGTDKWEVDLFFQGWERQWLFWKRKRRYVEHYRFPERDVSRMYLEL